MNKVEKIEVLEVEQPKIEELKIKPKKKRKRRWKDFLLLIGIIVVITIFFILLGIEYFAKPPGESNFKVKVINENPYPVTVYVIVYTGENYTAAYWNKKHISSTDSYTFKTPFLVKNICTHDGVRKVEVGIIMDNVVMNSQTYTFNIWYDGPNILARKSILTAYVYGIYIDFEY